MITGDPGETTGATNPQRPKEEYPWFWDGDTFKGERGNDVHLPITQKQAAKMYVKQE